jgi:hypothetical protein
MWIVLARPVPKDMPYWLGRRWLAALDAISWPALWIAVARHAPADFGLIAPVICAVAVLAGLSRLWTAVWRNERYRFTTWRWGRVLVGLMALGLLMKAFIDVW